MQTGATIGTGVPTQEFLVGAVWFDVHAKDFAVTRVFVEFEHLQEWAGPAHPVVERLEGDRYTASHAPHQDLEAEVDGTAIKLTTAHSLRLERTSTTLGSRRRFEVGPIEPIDLHAAEDRFVRPLRNLMTLAAARSTAMEDLTVELPATSLADSAEGPGQATILSNWIVRAQADDRPLMTSEFGFRLATIAPDLQGALVAWSKASSSYRSAFNLFFSAYDAPPRYVETRFLVHAMALEVYHRARIGGFRVSEEDHATRMERVLKKVCAEDEDWVRLAIEHSHNKSLADRVQELAADAPANVGEILGSAKDLAREVTRVRNGLTHGGRSGRPTHADFVLTHKIRLLLHACFMRELGLARDAVGAALEGSRLLREVRHIAASKDDE